MQTTLTLYDCMQFPETDYDFYELQKDFALAVTCIVYGFVEAFNCNIDLESEKSIV